MLRVPRSRNSDRAAPVYAIAGQGGEMTSKDRTAKRRPCGGWLALTVCLVFASQAANAADVPSGPVEHAGRPRIGLVLGGGGAKGAAHIGVIKVLEELRVPIDCIAGTSMGAIVGAAYATGMSAQQLEQVITAVDWKDLLASAPRQEVPVQRKSPDFIFTLGFEVGVKDGKVAPPGGLVPTHQIEALFRRIVAGAGQISKFDELPIPFRAVATDLESGAMHVFDGGDLAVAMRASMAVPGAFAPVDYGGRLYVDGMLVRNLPVDVARKLCGDVLIAVPVASPAATRERLTTLTGVAGQALNIAIDANERVQLATLTADDVEIPVILQDISSIDFAKVPEAIPIGEAAARKAAAALSRYSLSPEKYAAWRADLGKVAAVPTVKIDEVRMVGFNTTNPEVMRSFLRVKPGDVYDPARADADTTRLVARGDFTSVSYQLTAEDGRNVLTYTAVEKPWGPNYLLFDLNLSTYFRGEVAWGVRVDYEKRWLNALGGELRTSMQIGRPSFLAADFYQPLDTKQRFFLAPSVLAYQDLEYLYRGESRIAQLATRRYEAQLSAGIALGTRGEFRLGLMRGSVNSSVDVGSVEGIDLGAKSLGAGTMRFVFDTVDRPLFPSEGSVAIVGGNFSTAALGAERTYQTVSGQARTVVTSRRNVWTFSLSGGSDLNSGAPFYDQFKLGGLFKFSGYRPNELIGREYALGLVQFRRRIAYLIETLGTASWGGVTLEAGNVFRRLDGTPARGILFGGSLFVGVNSKLGPVYFGYGLSEGGHSAVYLYLGSSLEAF